MEKQALSLKTLTPSSYLKEPSYPDTHPLLPPDTDPYRYGWRYVANTDSDGKKSFIINYQLSIISCQLIKAGIIKWKNKHYP